MSFLAVATLWGVLALAAAAAAGVLAGMKNRDYSFWMGWAFLFPPAVGFLIMLPRRGGPRPRQPSLDELDQQPD
jgi:hypothetical protein